MYYLITSDNFRVKLLEFNNLPCLEPKLCEVGYFPDVAGYRKLYGDCRGHDINHRDLPTKECAAECDALPNCIAFAAINRAVFGSIGHNCYLKSFCNESTLVTSKPGLFTYVKGLEATGLKPVIVLYHTNECTRFYI